MMKQLNYTKKHTKLITITRQFSKFSWAYQIGNKFEQSKKLLLEMNNKFPNNASADHMYSSIHTYKTDDPHREQMIQKLSNSNITKEGLPS